MKYVRPEQEGLLAELHEVKSKSETLKCINLGNEFTIFVFLNVNEPNRLLET